MISKVPPELPVVLTSLRKRLADCHYKLSILDQTVLAKTFNGKLVSQDPNDEPAFLLIARLLDKHASTADKMHKRKPNKKGIGP